MKKIIIYSKDTGKIKSVIERKRPILNLQSDEAYLVVDIKSRVDIKKDMVIDGILCKYDDSRGKRTNNYDAQFPKYKNLIGMVYSHEKACGITNYSNDLINASSNNFIKFVNREAEIDEADNIVKCWSANDNDYNELFDKIIESGVEVVHIQYNHSLLNPSALKKLGPKLARRDIFSIITLHSAVGGVSIFKDYFDLIVVHSELCKNELMLEKVPEEKIKIVNIGSLKSNISDNMRPSLGFSDDDTLIFNFGFLLPHKGVDLLIDTFNDISYEVDKAKLIILGSIDNVQHKDDSQEHLEKLIEQVEKYGISDKVTFITEFLETEIVQRYLSCADVIVLPYRNSASQGASSTLRMAISVGKPIIVSDIPLFNDLRGVLKFHKANDKVSLKKAIVDVLDGSEGDYKSKIEQYIARTSWKKVGLEYSRVYRAFNDLKIHFESQIFSYQSTSQITRGLAESLDKLGVEVSMESVNMAENREYVFSEKFSHLIGDKYKSDICVRNFYPFKFDDWGDTKVKIGYLPAETTSISKEWIEGINNNLDFVWTYSNHCKQSMINSGVTKPIVLISPGFDPKRFNSYVEKVNWNSYVDSYTKEHIFPPIDDETFVFMFSGAASERKNIDILLQVIYSGKFTIDHNVLFVIKSYSTGEVHKNILKAQEESKLSKEKWPRMIYIYQDSLPEELIKMYKSVDLLILPSKAEGYCWPVLEAMSIGVPSLTTNFGGVLQFANNDTTYLLDGEMKLSTYHEQGSGAMWCELNSDDLANKIYDIYQKGVGDKEYQNKVNSGLVRCMDFTWESCALKVIEFLRKLKEDGKMS